MSSTTAQYLVELLHRHYIRNPEMPGGVFAAEIAAPDSLRRADVLWQGLTETTGRELVGHEIKVSRQDLRAELADPDKAEAWKKFCDRWWLVVPTTALLRGIEIPADWGVLTPPSGRRRRVMTVERPARELHPVDQTPGLRTLAAWLSARKGRLEQENHELRQRLTAAS